MKHSLDKRLQIAIEWPKLYSHDFEELFEILKEESSSRVIKL